MSEQVAVSSIVPKGAKLINVRNGQYAIPSLYLEVFEVVFGCLIVAFIVGRQYKALKKKVIKLPATEKAPILTPQEEPAQENLQKIS